MADLIDRQAAIDAINKAFARVFECDGTEPLGEKVLKDVPTIEERKHGEWLIDKSGSLMCSKCGTLLDEFQKPSRFCPNCGARMEDEP